MAGKRWKALAMCKGFLLQIRPLQFFTLFLNVHYFKSAIIRISNQMVIAILFIYEITFAWYLRICIGILLCIIASHCNLSYLLDKTLPVRSDEFFISDETFALRTLLLNTNYIKWLVSPDEKLWPSAFFT